MKYNANTFVAYTAPFILSGEILPDFKIWFRYYVASLKPLFSCRLWWKDAWEEQERSWGNEMGPGPSSSPCPPAADKRL